jgi:hypothetical protein
MAKKGKGKGKLPKTAAGMKVPKALRKSPLATLFDSELGRQILADAIVAAAGAAAAALVKHRPSAQQVAGAGKAVADAGVATQDNVQNAAGAVAHLVTEAAQHILPSSMTGAGARDEGDDDVGSARRGKKDKDYAHLADQDRKGKRTKNRIKPSEH